MYLVYMDNLSFPWITTITKIKFGYQLPSFFNYYIINMMLVNGWVYFLDKILSYRSFKYPLSLVKIGVSTFHFLPHLPIHLHFMHLEGLNMHS
jgi:hypothetical protein